MNTTVESKDHRIVNLKKRKKGETKFEILVFRIEASQASDILAKLSTKHPGFDFAITEICKGEDGK
jgi:hypothetical protein